MVRAPHSEGGELGETALVEGSLVAGLAVLPVAGEAMVVIVAGIVKLLAVLVDGGAVRMEVVGVGVAGAEVVEVEEAEAVSPMVVKTDGVPWKCSGRERPAVAEQSQDSRELDASQQ